MPQLTFICFVSQSRSKERGVSCQERTKGRSSFYSKKKEIFSRSSERKKKSLIPLKTQRSQLHDDNILIECYELLTEPVEKSTIKKMCSFIFSDWVRYLPNHSKIKSCGNEVELLLLKVDMRYKAFAFMDSTAIWCEGAIRKSKRKLKI